MYDIIILGGGIAGLSLAYRCMNSVKLLLIEKNDFFSGTTSQSLAGFSLSYSPELFNPYMQDCLNFYTQLNPQILTPRGRLIVLRNNKMNKCHEYKKLGFVQIDNPLSLTHLGIRSSCIPAMIDFFDFKQFSSVFYEKEYFDLEITYIKEEMLRACYASNNIDLHHFEPVTDIIYHNNVWHVNTKLKTYKSPIIINAIGPWSHQLFSNNTIPLQRNRFDCACVHFDSGPRSLNFIPAITNDDMSFFIKPKLNAPNDFIVASKKTEQTLNDHDQSQLPDCLAVDSMLTELRKVTFSHRLVVNYAWVGVKINTNDLFPIIGFDAIKKGLFWYNGFAGYGNKLAPLFSKIAYDIINNRHDDVSPCILKKISPSRFVPKV